MQSTIEKPVLDVDVHHDDLFSTLIVFLTLRVPAVPPSIQSYQSGPSQCLPPGLLHIQRQDRDAIANRLHPHPVGNRLACVGRAFSCMRLLNPINLFKRHAAFVDHANSVAEAPKPTPDASASKESSECRADDSSHGSEVFPITDIAVESHWGGSEISPMMLERFHTFDPSILSANRADLSLNSDADSTVSENKSDLDPVDADHFSIEKTLQHADSVEEAPKQTLTTSEREITGTTTPNNSVCSEPSADNDITFIGDIVEDEQDNNPDNGDDALASQQNGSQAQTLFKSERIDVDAEVENTKQALNASSNLSAKHATANKPGDTHKTALETAIQNFDDEEVSFEDDEVRC